MTLTLNPDAEKLVSGWLRGHPDVAAIVGRRVVSKTPSEIAQPWVRMTLLDESDDAVSGVEHLLTFMLQFDCYAGYQAPDDAGHGLPEASLLRRTVRAALKEMQGVVLDGQAVVTAVRFIGAARVPDPDFEPARERMILTAQVWMHA